MFELNVLDLLKGLVFLFPSYSKVNVFLNWGILHCFFKDKLKLSRTINERNCSSSCVDGQAR